MHIIKIGSRFVNLDQATHVAPNPFPGDITNEQRIAVYFAAGYEYDNEPGQHGATFTGDEAAALTRYLNSIATDVCAAEHTDAGYRDFTTRGGKLSYTVWQEKTRKYADAMEKSESWWSHPANVQYIRDLESELLV